MILQLLSYRYQSLLQVFIKLQQKNMANNHNISQIQSVSSMSLLKGAQNTEKPLLYPTSRFHLYSARLTHTRTHARAHARTQYAHTRTNTHTVAVCF